MGNAYKKYTTAQYFLFNLFSLLTIIPAAPYLNRFIPPVMIGTWNVDLFLAILASFLITRLFYWIFKPLIIPLFVVIMGILIFGQFTSRYTFSNVIKDYQALVQNNWVTKDNKEQDLLSFYPERFESYANSTAESIHNKLDYKDSLVRNFSVKHSLDYFDEYYPKYERICRWLSLFKYINEHFNYVPDAQRDDYFATAHETIEDGLGGDCDDHSILMASCLRSIGAQTRVVLIQGHAYPELYCGDKEEFEIMQQAIIQLFAGQDVESIFFHESNGEYWVNLDYTAKHPGGRYIQGKLYALIPF